MAQIESLAFNNKHRFVTDSGIRCFFGLKMDKAEGLELPIRQARALHGFDLAELAEDALEIFLAPV
jgi:hypothetical protein